MIDFEKCAHNLSTAANEKVSISVFLRMRTALTSCRHRVVKPKRPFYRHSLFRVRRERISVFDFTFENSLGDYIQSSNQVVQ